MANDIIDINVFETIETVAITVQPNLTTINVNSVTTGANLDYTASPTNGIVSSDTGTDATIPLADSTNAGLISPSEKTKLAGIATGAEVNVNADWNSTSGDSQILNKPSIPSIAGLATVTYVDTQDALKVDKIAGKGLSTNDFTDVLKTKLDGVQSGAEVNVNADWNSVSGDSEILNKPSIPSIAGLATVTYVDTQDALKVDKVAGSRLITSAESTLIGNTSGVNTGDQDLTNLVVKNTAIVGATKTKITYDSKGLVTVGADATTVDIADTSNKRYVTDANLVTIGNQSGTNTGDQDLSTLVVKNTAIVGATKTKITYDAKGLVTVGADATTADIADSSNKRYQTDNQQSFNDATSSIQTQINSKQNTLTNPITGTGTTNYVSKFTGSTSLGNSLIYDDGSNVGIGTTSPAWKLDVSGVGRFRDANAYEGAFIEGTNGVAYFGSLAADAISLYSGGVSRVYINSSGNVGIGTTSPVAISNYTTLDLRGTNGSLLYMGQAGATASLRLIGEGTDGYIDNINISGGLLFRTNAATERMRITLGGNVGIGTTTPSVKLEVVGNIKSSLSGYEFQIYPAFDTNVVGMGASSNHNLAIVTNAAERMRITSAGNVGIGTTSPGAKLDVQLNTTGDNLLRIWNTNTSGTGKAIIRVANSGNNTQGSQIQFTDNDYYVGTLTADRTNGMSFFVGQQGSPLDSERMRITSSGNVGIGTTSPFTILELKSNDPVQRFSVNGGATNNKTYEIRGIGASGFEGLQFRAVNDANTVYDSLMFLARNGNVGIGTTSPNSILEISQASPIFRIQASDTGTFHGIEFRQGAGFDAFIKQLPATGEFRISNGRSAGWGGFTSFYTDTVERMRITPAGNVGIGTSSPTKRLDVVSSTNDSFDAIVVRPLNQTQTLNIGWQGIATSLNFIVSTNGSEKMRVDTTGNVGIGTSSPASLLHLSSNSSPFIRLQTTNGSGKTWGIGVDNAFGNGINFSEIGVADARLFIANGGNVGIGTTSPSEKLEVNGNIGLAKTGETFIYNTQNSTDSISIGGASYVSFKTYNGAFSERMRITSGGNIGIGTTTPSSLLHLYKTSFPVLTIGSGTITANMGIDTSNNILNIGTETSNAFKFSTSNIERMRIDSMGNVLINASSNFGAGKLEITYNGQTQTALDIKTTHIDGNNLRFFNSMSSVVGSIYSNSVSTSYNTTSDYRLKEDFKEIKGLDLISKIKVYDFKWKDSNSRMDGVIAHELQDVVPYAVTGEKDAKEMQSVDYSKLVPILVKAIQDQQKQIDELKKLINK